MSPYEKINRTARLTTLLSPIVCLLYGLAIGVLATFKPDSIPTGAFQGGTLLLFPFLLAIALVAWKWPIPGGILILGGSLPIFFAILSATGWPGWYKIPYITLWVIFVSGGLLHITSAFLKRISFNY